MDAITRIEREQNKIYKLFNKTISKKDSRVSIFLRTKAFRIFQAMTIKTLEKLNEDVMNEKYYDFIEKTKGEYKNRMPNGVYSSNLELYKYAMKLYEDNKNNKENKRIIENSFIGIYTDLWDVISDVNMAKAFKEAFRDVEKNGNYSPIYAFKLIYILGVIALDEMSFKLTSLRYKYDSNLDKVELMMVEDRGFIQNIIFPAIKIAAYCKAIKNPMEEINNLKSSFSQSLNFTKESLEYNYFFNMMNNPTKEYIKSVEDSYKDQLTNLGVGALSAGGFTALLVSGALSLPFALIGGAIIIGIAIFTIIIPGIRYISYYSVKRKVEKQEMLEIQNEMIKNNIEDLKKKRDEVNDDNTRRKYQDVIDKQDEMVNQLQDKIDKMQYGKNYNKESNYTYSDKEIQSEMSSDDSTIINSLNDKEENYNFEDDNSSNVEDETVTSIDGIDVIL